MKAARKGLAEDKKLALEILAGISEDDLETKPTPAPWDPRPMPLGQRLLSMAAHLATHKNQLFYYLKLQGKPVNTNTLWERARPKIWTRWIGTGRFISPQSTIRRVRAELFGVQSVVVHAARHALAEGVAPVPGRFVRAGGRRLLGEHAHQTARASYTRSETSAAFPSEKTIRVPAPKNGLGVFCASRVTGAGRSSSTAVTAVGASSANGLSLP